MNVVRGFPLGWALKWLSAWGDPKCEVGRGPDPYCARASCPAFEV